MVTLEQRDKLWVGQFRCMASPCEVLIETDDKRLAQELIDQAIGEARRIEQKFSRYLDNNIVHQINNTHSSVEVDEETARLLDFADNCFQLSDGLFDITSGILRRAWNYDTAAVLPQQNVIDQLLTQIGWDKVSWNKPLLSLPAGMEIDFGGIGKEYAVDAVVTLLRSQTDQSLMINFGGDCHASKALADGSAWITGIENPNQPGDASAILQLRQGALATSGNTYRFIEHSDVRYGHILNPRSGWPDVDAPLSVTVAAATCTEAGVLSTLAMLQGAAAEEFLQQQGLKFWCYR